MDKQNLLEKYLNNTITHDELQILWQLLKEDPQQEYEEVMQKIWQQVSHENKLQATDRQRIAKNVLHQIQVTPTRKLTPYRAYAAAIALVIAASFMLYFFVLNAPQQTIYTANGETKSVVLPDQSVVTLNSNSKLTYQTKFVTAHKREVWIEGEGFFEVKKLNIQEGNQTLPASFVVHTANMDIQVLGTTFNVKDRRGKSSVVLNTGKIKLLTKDSAEMYLEPGEMAEVSDQKQEVVKKEVDPEKYISWKSNMLVCDATTLQEIGEVIQDRFGYQISFEDPALRLKTMSGNLPLENTESFFGLLEEAMNIRIIKKEDQTLLIQAEK